MLGFVINPLTHRFEKTGLVYVSTNPPDATVYIDGRVSHQKTPTAIRDLTPGEHFIRIELSSYNDWERNIPIVGKKATVLANTLLIPEECFSAVDLNKPFISTGIEAFVTAGTSCSFQLAPWAKVIGQLSHQVLEPVRLNEQGRSRPVLICSGAALNAMPIRHAHVVPVTTTDRRLRHHVEVTGSGLERRGWAMPEYLRSMSTTRFGRHLGWATPETMRAVEEWISILGGPLD